MHTTDDLVSGRYRLHEKLGSGGMGVVWRATDELLNRQVAIKRIRLDLRTDETAELSRRRTLREARIAAQLHHPNVVSIFDVLTVDGDPWLVLEHLPCDTLSSAIKTHGPPGARTAAGIGIAVADALAAAHDVGIVHRDVKPANVLLGRDGTVKLSDFGIAHAVGDINLTGTGLITGTPAYLAPEVARGGPSGAPSDVYSLGATLYAAVEGVPPFQSDDNVFRMLQLVAAGEVPPPRNAGELEPVLRRLMSIDPQARPGAAQAREMLRGVLDGRPRASSMPARPLPQPVARVPAVSDSAARSAALVAAVVVVLVLVAFLAVTLG
ncbi:MAG: serine/threonine-protein kinase [Pseudonocardia sp.]